TDALEQRKTDQLRRLIELAEVLEEVLERNSRIDAPAAPRTPDIAEELHSRAPRRDDGLLRQLEHPSLAEFSLKKKKRRLIELAEVLEEVLERNSRIDAPAAPRTPDIAEELHSRAPRRDDGLLRQLEHPSLAEFSLSSKSKVHQHSTMKSFSRGPALWKRDAMVSTLMNDLSNASDSAAGGAGSSPKLTRTSPVPTVATLTPAPQYNPHAKKQVSKWDRQLPPLR
ncbi:Hypothetical protein, putative, partial [Bodo saltans]